MDEKEYWRERPFYSCCFLTSLSGSYGFENVSNFLSIGHFVQASKAKLFQDQSAFWKLMDEAKTRAEHEKIGRSIQNFDQNTWNKWKPKIVQSALDCIRLKSDAPEVQKHKLWYAEYGNSLSASLHRRHENDQVWSRVMK